MTFHICHTGEAYCLNELLDDIWDGAIEKNKRHMNHTCMALHQNVDFGVFSNPSDGQNIYHRKYIWKVFPRYEFLHGLLDKI